MALGAASSISMADAASTGIMHHQRAQKIAVEWCHRVCWSMRRRACDAPLMRLDTEVPTARSEGNDAIESLYQPFAPRAQAAEKEQIRAQALTW